MLRDLDKELSDFASRRQKSSSSGGGGGGGSRATAARAAGAAAGVAKSLWDELSEIGEEFVDFLEQASMPPGLPNTCGWFDCPHQPVLLLLLVGKANGAQGSNSW